MEKAGTLVTKTIQQIKETAERSIFRFDIFKGVKDSSGRIQKVKSLGYALINEGAHTYTIHLKSLLKDQFYMLPERTHTDLYDFVILTREESFREGRKFFWNNVGEAKLLDGINRDVLQLKWDIFGADDIYLNTIPMKKSMESHSTHSVPNSQAA